jgi:hypothetical protein
MLNERRLVRSPATLIPPPEGAPSCSLPPRTPRKVGSTRSCTTSNRRARSSHATLHSPAYGWMFENRHRIEVPHPYARSAFYPLEASASSYRTSCIAANSPSKHTPCSVGLPSLSANCPRRIPSRKGTSIRAFFRHRGDQSVAPKTHDACPGCTAALSEQTEQPKASRPRASNN